MEVNGELVQDVGYTTPEAGDWATRSVDLADYAGQAVDIAWRFDSIDSAGNDLLGCQVGSIRLDVQLDNDCNSSGALDECDLSSGISVDLNHTGRPDECEPAGDFDGDGDAALLDFAHLPGCLSGPEAGSFSQPECGIFDFDPDGDVDLQDYAAWQSGPK